MNHTQKLLFAKNELENVMSGLQKDLELENDDMMIIIELLLSTSRYRSLVKNAYDQLTIVKQTHIPKEGEIENGNTNEKGQ